MKDDIKITLLHYTPLDVCSTAIRTCYQSFKHSDGGGERDKALIKRVGNDLKHSSTLEHLVYSFFIDGISRACLMELSRHRIASLSVKSTRWTLKELKKEEEFREIDARLKRYIVLTNNDDVNEACMKALENLRILIAKGVTNDVAKYALPECYKVQLTYTINARSLQNFLNLRSAKEALLEIRNLANYLFSALPNDHQYLFKEFMGT